MIAFKMTLFDIAIILIAFIIAGLSAFINYDNIFSFPVLIDTLQIMVVIGLLIMVLNYRHEKRMAKQRAIAADNEKLKYFYENPLPMWIYEKDTLSFMDVNDAALIKYGYSKDEFLQLTLLDIRPKSEHSELREYFERDLNSFESGDTWKHLTKDGRGLLVQLSAHSILFENKQCRMVALNDITEYIKARNEIDDYKKFLADVLERIEDSIWVVDPDLKLLNSNHIFRKHTKELYHTDIKKGQSVLLPSFPHRTAQFLRKQYITALNGKDVKFDFTNHTVRGEQHAQVKLLPVKDQSGIIKYLVCSATDVTEYLKVKNQYQESLDQFNLASKSTNDAIWDLDLTEKTVKWGEGLTKRFGYHTHETSLDWWYEQIHPDDREEVEKEFNAMLESSRSNWRDSYRFKTADGANKYVIDQGFVMRDKDGHAYRMIGAIQDIDDQVCSQKEITKLSMVASKTSNAVIITDENEHIEWVNDGFTKMTGHSLDEVIGKKPGKLLQGEGSDKEVLKKLRQAISKGNNITVELINYHKSGREYWVEMAIFPVFNNNEIEQFIAIETDITQRKKRELHLQEKNRILEGIAYITAHGLRKPLANILGLSQLLKSKHDNKEDSEEIYNLIRKSAKELDQQVKEIIDNAYKAQKKLE